MQIYSRLEPNKVLHLIKNVFDINGYREDLTSHEKYIQASIIKITPGYKTTGHIHQPKSSIQTNSITQEVWVVMSGEVRIKLFDTDKTLLNDSILTAGHIVITFYGGHLIEATTENAVILEIKNGPYTGKDYELIT